MLRGLSGCVSTLTAVLVLVFGIHSSHALQCYECMNVEMVGGDSSGLFKLLQGKTNPQCGSNPSSGNTVTCPSDYSCGAVNGDLKGSMLGGILGKLHARVQMRGCIEGKSLIGCKTADRDLGGMLSKAVGVLTEVSDLTVDGEVCSCGWDLCVPDCGPSGLHIGDICIPLWAVIVGAVGGILIPVLCITCCCCCCGCCCCNKKTPGRVITAPAAPYRALMVFQQQSPAPDLQYNMTSVNGLENPLFGQPEAARASDFSRLEQA